MRDSTHRGPILRIEVTQREIWTARDAAGADIATAESLSELRRQVARFALGSTTLGRGETLAIEWSFPQPGGELLTDVQVVTLRELRRSTEVRPKVVWSQQRVDEYLRGLRESPQP